MCIVRNEGGTQENFDILPSATEEAYLRTYPEERAGHAFLSFCREGDLDAVIHMVKDLDDSDEPEGEDEADADGSGDEVLRYNGTFEGIEGTGLHVAVRYGREEVAWLLLALASPLDWSKFPIDVLQAMERLGLSKDDRQPGVDIRAMKDSSSRTVNDLAKEIGGIWISWVSSERLDAGV